MRRSILIVMLDVMVLSVLALTAGLRNGGGDASKPVPLYRISSMVEEGLRNEENFVAQVASLKAQLAEASEIAQKALEQVEQTQSEVSLEREGNRKIQEELRKAELAAERARSQATLASREAELSEQKTAEFKQRALEMEKRTAEMQARTLAMQEREIAARMQADAALADARAAEADALAAERKAFAAARVSETLKQEIEQASSQRASESQDAEENAMKLRVLQAQLAAQNVDLQEARAAEAIARVRADAALGERQRLAVKSEELSGRLVELHEQVAVLEVEKEGATEKVAALEDVQRKAEEDKQRSVWVRRDEAMRKLSVVYTEFSGKNDRSYTTRKTVTMPVVMVGTKALIPADFRKLGLNSSFWGGLSDYVTDVAGVLTPIADPNGARLPIRSIIVPGVEPQVCFVLFDGDAEGALNSISMKSLKEQRLKSALLFSPDDANEHGRVEMVPVVGRDYLKITHMSGRKPKVGDYLLSDRGEFIGVMITKEDCYVTPQILAANPAPIAIPFEESSSNDAYKKSFVRALKAARARMKQHLSTRKL